MGEAAYGGVGISRRRVLRRLRGHGLLAPCRVGAPRGPRNHDGTIIPDALDAAWRTDLATTWTAQGQAAMFVALDHCSAECVGPHAARRGTRFEAPEPLRQGVRQHLGTFVKDIARGLGLRHDHGSQSTSDAFQGEPRFLGIERAPARSRASSRLSWQSSAHSLGRSRATGCWRRFRPVAV